MGEGEGEEKSLNQTVHKLLSTTCEEKEALA